MIVLLQESLPFAYLNLKSYISKDNDVKNSELDLNSRNMSYHYYALGDNKDDDSFNGSHMKTVLSDCCLKRDFLANKVW